MQPSAARAEPLPTLQSSGHSLLPKACSLLPAKEPISGNR